MVLCICVGVGHQWNHRMFLIRYDESRSSRQVIIDNVNYYLLEQNISNELSTALGFNERAQHWFYTAVYH